MERELRKQEIEREMKQEAEILLNKLSGNSKRLFQEFLDFEKNTGNKVLLILKAIVGNRYRSMSRAYLIIQDCNEFIESKNLNLESYEDYCEKVFNLIVFKSRNIIDRNLERLIKKYVIVDLKSNLVSPLKNKELIYKAYKTLNNKDITVPEYKLVRALVWRLNDEVERVQETFGPLDVDNLNKVKDIYYSYLELLNLKQYREITEAFFERIVNDNNLALKYYYPMLFVKRGMYKAHKGNIETALDNLYKNEKESVAKLNRELIEDLTSENVIRNGEGKEILLVSSCGADTLELEGYTITFIERRFYDTLIANDAYNFSKYNYIKFEQDLKVQIFRD